jgi:hypothetical protein
MRVEVTPQELEIRPGEPTTLTVSVFNTADVIEGISVRVLGLDPAHCSAEPGMLALFPDTSGTTVVTLDLPPEFPAGVHELSVEASSVHGTARVTVPFQAKVPLRVDAELRVEPARLTGRRGATGRLHIANRGNGTLRLALSAADHERFLDVAIVPSTVDVEPGEAISTVAIKGPLRWFGSPSDRPFTVKASPRAFDAPAGDEPLDLAATGTFHHQPLIPRGVFTTGMLGSIVAIWALVFLFVLGRILTEDTPGKTAPASYFATSAEVVAAGGGAADPELPIGAARLAASARGAVQGVVHSASTDEPVGRISVEAVRLGRYGPVVASTVATDETGAFQLGGLPPGTYTLRYTAPGFLEQWYPASSGLEGADRLKVGAGDSVDVADVSVTGLPGSITGTVDTGQDLAALVSVQVRALIGGVPTAVVREVVADSTGQYVVPNLPTPGVYELTVVSGQYRPATFVTRLGGGEHRLEAEVRLSAGTGSVAGLVTDDAGKPLGGVAIKVQSGDKELTTATPTAGPVGTYRLNDLPTPGTYLLSFSAEGYGTEILAVDLGPGASRSNLDVKMTRGTGSIGGVVTDEAGNPLGDVAVSVNGPAGTVQTATLTTGNVGRYGVSGLATPGSYSLTFTKPGYATTTVDVDLARTGSAPNTDVTMPTRSAVLKGTIRGTGDHPLPGATIRVSDGTTERTTIAASNPAGAYELVGLAPGTYSVTVEAPGHETATVLVELAPGATLVRDLTLVPPGP